MRFMAVSLASIAAVAVAGVLTLGSAQALPKMDGPGVGATTEVVKYMKKKRHYHRHYHHHHHWHTCGVYKYRHHGKCHDARKKK